MGRHGPYRPGSFYRNDDRTGFPQRAERTQKQWDGLIVDQKVWEPRQPQDLVRGVRDDQAVPEPRPLPPAQFVTMLYYTLAATSPPGSYSIQLQNTAGMTVGDYIGIILADGSTFQTIIAGGDALLDVNGNVLFDSNGSGFPLYDDNGVNGPGVGILNPLPQSAPSGNLVIDYRVRL